MCNLVYLKKQINRTSDMMHTAFDISNALFPLPIRNEDQRFKILSGIDKSLHLQSYPRAMLNLLLSIIIIVGKDIDHMDIIWTSGHLLGLDDILLTPLNEQEMANALGRLCFRLCKIKMNL